MTYSNYIVYVDESGDHGLENVNPVYPVFVLAFCIFDKEEYLSKVIPALTRIKFDTFGHDMVILHEHDMRKKLGAFRMMNKEDRGMFMECLNEVIRETRFGLIAVAVDKQRFLGEHQHSNNLYNLAMRIGLEGVFRFLNGLGQAESLTHIVFEGRGKREDAELELEFRRVCDGANNLGYKLPFEIVLAEKRVNSAGLQLADMTARPIGLGILRPDQPNRAMSLLKDKLQDGRSEILDGSGLKIFPK